MPQTQIVLSLYLCNMMMYTFDINNISWKYHMFTLSGCKDQKMIRKLEFLATTQYVS